MHPCCFCDAPIEARFHFCKACKAQYDAALGPGWEQSDWFKETAKLSRRVDYLERNEIPFSALAPGELDTAQPIPPRLPDPLDELITKALETAPDAGWRRMHRIVQEQGIEVTGRKVQLALERIRKART